MDVYVAGAVAAFTVDVLVYPLDTLKTRYQSQDYLKAYRSGSGGNALALAGLYQGIGIVVLATLPAAGVFFSTYERAKTFLSGRLPGPEALVHSSASALAEVASCLVLAPAEVVKQNAQMLRRGTSSSSSSSSSTSMQAFRQLAGPGARRRLFTGYTALVARNLPFTGLQFPVFEHLRTRLWESRERGRRRQPRGLVETGLIAGASAGTAGAVAAFLTTPGDVVKTRMMVTAGGEGSGGGATGPRPKQGSWAVAKQVHRERGIRGLFRGGLFRSSWTALGSSLYLGSYDTAKLWLRRRKDGREDDSISSL
ncbi:hypothetical protein CDD83_479 [Cordyceps sp. RAO-2017]|nr:hypothetical protein CDD83_479 [Cordyceps sp. RAO-2017]